MRYTLSADDLVFLLDARIISLFNSRGVNDRNYRRKHQSFLKRGVELGLTDSEGVPNQDLARTLAPIKINRCEVSCPYPFESLENVKLRCTFFISEEGITFAKDVSNFRRQYELEFMEGMPQVKETFIREAGLLDCALSATPFCLDLFIKDGNQLMGSFDDGDYKAVRHVANEHQVPYDELLSVLKDFRKADKGQQTVILVAREAQNSGTIMLTIVRDKAAGVRMVVFGGHDRDAEELASFERITNSDLWEYALDFKGR